MTRKIPSPEEVTAAANGPPTSPSWTKATVSQRGVSWPLQKGWREKLKNDYKNQILKEKIAAINNRGAK